MTDELDLGALGASPDVCPRPGCGMLVDDHTVRDLREHLANLDTPITTRPSLYGTQEVDPAGVDEVLGFSVVGMVASMEAEHRDGRVVPNPEAFPSIGIQFVVQAGTLPVFGIAERRPGQLAQFARAVNTAVNDAIREAKAENKRRRAAGSN